MNDGQVVDRARVRGGDRHAGARGRSHHGVGPGADLYGIVSDGDGDFPDNAPPMVAVDDAVSGFQWSFGELAPGEVAWAAIAVMHDPDPFAGRRRRRSSTRVDARRRGPGGRRRAGAWDEFQAGVTLPAG
jgi:hypothetical protein